MTPAEAAETRELKDMLHDAAGHLSPTHVAALFAHPLLRSSWSPCCWAGISAGVALPGSHTETLSGDSCGLSVRAHYAHLISRYSCL